MSSLECSAPPPRRPSPVAVARRALRGKESGAVPAVEGGLRYSVGRAFVVENPGDRGRAPFASMFIAEEMVILPSNFQAEDVVLDQ